MPATISNAFRGLLFAQNAEGWVAALLELTHPDWPGVTRISTAGTRISDDPLTYGVVHNGETYLFAPMQFKLPADIEGQAPNAQLVIENVSRDLLAFARSVTTPGKCVIKIITSEDVDLVEREFPELDIKGAVWNAETITLEMGLDALDTEPIPSDTFTPAGFPGLF